MFELTKIKEAQYFAIKMHSAHSYGDYPYLYHLDQVIYFLRKFGFTSDKYIIAAYLHDIIEDCGITYNDVNKRYGKEIADMVWAVSGFGKTRKERFECVVPKINANDDSLKLKLADRIANITSSLKNKPHMADMYKKELPYFREKLYKPNVNIEPMWVYLEALVKGELV